MQDTYFPNDSRFYLKEEFNKRKQLFGQYSLRTFAKDLKVSPSFLSEFLNGQQGISKDRVYRIGKVINLPPAQVDHFWDLVESEYGRSPNTKQQAQLRAENRIKSATSRLLVDKYKFSTQWFHRPILELLSLQTVKLNPEQIALSLSLPSDTVKESLQVLMHLNLIRKTKSGYETTEENDGYFKDTSLNALKVNHENTLASHVKFHASKGSTDCEGLSASFKVKNKDWMSLQNELQKKVLETIKEFSESSTEADQVVSFTMQSAKLVTNDILFKADGDDL